VRVSRRSRQRSVVEARGAPVRSDVSRPVARDESLTAEALQEIKSRVSPRGESPRSMAGSHGEWTGTRYNVFVPAYKHQTYSQDATPQGLMGPRDHQMEGAARDRGDDRRWFGGRDCELGEERGTQVFRDIAATNGIRAHGTTRAPNSSPSGEGRSRSSIMPTRAIQLSTAGAGRRVTVPPTIARLERYRGSRARGHPNAASFFLSSALTEAQEL